jgi:hypothetical protein
MNRGWRQIGVNAEGGAEAVSAFSLVRRTAPPKRQGGEGVWETASGGAVLSSRAEP